MLRKALTFFLTLFIVGSVALVYYQEYLFLPYYAETQRSSVADRMRPLPPGVERELIGEVGGKIEAWVMKPKTPPLGVAIAFRGNGAPLEEHLSLPELAADHGLIGVVFNFPGMGMSEGTPTEASILHAGEEVISHYYKKGDPAAGKLWIIGYSFGTGPATILAEKYQPDLLMLFAPYTDLRDIVKTRPIYRFYASFSRLAFPTLPSVAALRTSNLIVATGGNDWVIPNPLSDSVFEAYQGSGQKFRFHNPAGQHHMLLGANRPEINKALKELGYTFNPQGPPR